MIKIVLFSVLLFAIGALVANPIATNGTTTKMDSSVTDSPDAAELSVKQIVAQMKWMALQVQDVDHRKPLFARSFKFDACGKIYNWEHTPMLFHRKRFVFFDMSTDENLFKVKGIKRRGDFIDFTLEVKHRNQLLKVDFTMSLPKPESNWPELVKGAVEPSSCPGKSSS